MKEDHIIITVNHKNTAESWSNSTAYHANCLKNKDIIPIVENSTSITILVCLGFFFFFARRVEGNKGIVFVRKRAGD